jgi:hypothetical protein
MWQRTWRQPHVHCDRGYARYRQQLTWTTMKLLPVSAVTSCPVSATPNTMCGQPHVTKRPAPTKSTGIICLR